MAFYLALGENLRMRIFCLLLDLPGYHRLIYGGEDCQAYLLLILSI